MRIQDTGRILKESRHARHAAALHHHQESFLSRMRRTIARLFHRPRG